MPEDTSLAHPVLFVISLPDPASVNIGRKIQSAVEWTEAGQYNDQPLFKHDRFILARIPELHLNQDALGESLKNETGIELSAVVYLSKHRSESGQRSLTVHPIGNFTKADFGGLDGMLATTAPALMTAALRSLKEQAKETGLVYSVSFEATHHGPFTKTPSFFIEIGSSEKEWEDGCAAEVIARALLTMKPKIDHPIAIGIGGGHYMPRMTDVALSRKVSFGHMIPSYAISSFDDNMLNQSILQTPGVSIAYLHRKAMKKDDIVRVEKLCLNRGLRVVREDDLDSF